nr:hypothetical protein [Azospirillum cavernae]
MLVADGGQIHIGGVFFGIVVNSLAVGRNRFLRATQGIQDHAKNKPSVAIFRLHPKKRFNDVHSLGVTLEMMQTQRVRDPIFLGLLLLRVDLSKHRLCFCPIQPPSLGMGQIPQNFDATGSNRQSGFELFARRVILMKRVMSQSQGVQSRQIVFVQRQGKLQQWNHGFRGFCQGSNRPQQDQRINNSLTIPQSVATTRHRLLITASGEKRFGVRNRGHRGHGLGRGRGCVHCWQNPEKKRAAHLMGSRTGRQSKGTGRKRDVQKKHQATKTARRGQKKGAGQSLPPS